MRALTSRPAACIPTWRRRWGRAGGTGFPNDELRRHLAGASRRRYAGGGNSRGTGMKQIAVVAALIITVATLIAGATYAYAHDSNPAPATAPAGLSISDTDTPGDVTVSWQPVAGAAYYRIGWVALDDFHAITEPAVSGWTPSPLRTSPTGAKLHTPSADCGRGRSTPSSLAASTIGLATPRGASGLTTRRPTTIIRRRRRLRPRRRRRQHPHPLQGQSMATTMRTTTA